MTEKEIIKQQSNKLWNIAGRSVTVWGQIERVVTETYHARDVEVTNLKVIINELNERGEHLTRDFNNAKKLLNQYMEAITDLKFENAKLKNHE